MERVIEVKINDKNLDLEKVYKVAINDFLFNGGDGFDMFRKGKVVISDKKNIKVIPSVISYVKTQIRLMPKIEGRIRSL